MAQHRVSRLSRAGGTPGTLFSWFLGRRLMHLKETQHGGGAGAAPSLPPLLPQRLATCLTGTHSLFSRREIP